MNQLDVLRGAVLELAIIVKNAADPDGRLDKVIERVKALDALSHAAIADDNDPEHCRHCGYLIHTAVTHIWPLRI
jgi:hypothetical protein